MNWPENWRGKPVFRHRKLFSDGLDMTELLDLIRNESAGTVGETLDFWLYECSMDEAPSAAEVAQWRDILNARGGRFARLAALCQTWLDEEQP